MWWPRRRCTAGELTFSSTRYPSTDIYDTGRSGKPGKLPPRSHRQYSSDFIEAIGKRDINILDFESIACIAESVGLPLIVDNTFATPYLLRRFDYGADVVVHSATKYISGHGAYIGTLVVDGGNFHWANSEFPNLTRPDSAYPGFLPWEKSGNYAGAGDIAYITKVCEATPQSDRRVNVVKMSVYIESLNLT